MKTKSYIILTLIGVIGLLCYSCGSSSGSSRSYARGGVHYHHGIHSGWGYPYGYGTDVIIIDDAYDYDYGMPEAVPLPADGW